RRPASGCRPGLVWGPGQVRIGWHQDDPEVRYPCVGLSADHQSQGHRMSCETCGDKGITRLNWADHAEEYSVCLCPAGLELRKAENSGKTCVPLWVLWAHQRGIA